MFKISSALHYTAPAPHVLTCFNPFPPHVPCFTSRLTPRSFSLTLLWMPWTYISWTTLLDGSMSSKCVLLSLPDVAYGWWLKAVFVGWRQPCMATTHWREGRGRGGGGRDEKMQEQVWFIEKTVTKDGNHEWPNGTLGLSQVTFLIKLGTGTLRTVTALTGYDLV